jgi:uncharacterized phage protein (TIGR01671 family)
MNNHVKFISRSTFRTWDVKNKKFLPESNFAILGNGKLIVTLSGYYNHFTNTNQDDYVVQQYTGLTDINDNPIYEGDILKINYDVGGNIIGQVLYEDDHGGYIFQWERNGPNQNYDNLNCDVAFESVIVGNIFEHSELLK